MRAVAFKSIAEGQGSGAERVQQAVLRGVVSSSRTYAPVVSRTLTYFLAGALAYRYFHYAETMGQPSSGMRPATDAIVYFGPALQASRSSVSDGVLPIPRKTFRDRSGWLLMAWMLIGPGILGTFAAPAGSLEGLIFTTTPVLKQVGSYLEVATQAVLLSVLLWV